MRTQMNQAIDSFALDLSGLIIHLEYQRKRVLENPYTRERMCFCRSLIMERYTSTLQKFLIRLSARTLKFFDDYNYAVTTDMTDLQEWFYAEIYDVLYSDPEVSNKMILLFRTVQEKLDQKFFDIIDKRYRDIIQYHNDELGDEFGFILESLYSDVRKWFEVFIYNILAVQLNCENIEDSILTDNEVQLDAVCCGATGRVLDVCKTCPFQACRSCDIHAKVADKGENIVVVMTPELVECSSWLDNLFMLIENYHKDPSVVKMTFDFRMYDYASRFYFNQRLKGRLLKSVDMFGKNNVSIRNYDGVEFGHFTEFVEEFTRK